MTAPDSRSRPVVCLGPYIVDVLARPVTEIPAGQGGARVEEIRVTAAGTGGGTAVDLAQLGVPTIALGVIGDDELGDLLVALLQRHGVDAAGLRRTGEVQTAATVLPIRPNGERPALHCPGAYPRFRFDDEAAALVASAGVLHLGGPERFDHPGELVAAARTAKENDALITLDVLAADPAGGRAVIDELLGYVDVFCPNDDQLLALYGNGSTDLFRAAAAARDKGAGAVVVTCGADGARILDDAGWRHEPAYAADVVDTTGCGDSVCAGLIEGLRASRDLDAAVRRGLAAAALVCEHLGSEAGLSAERVDAVEADRTRSRG